LLIGLLAARAQLNFYSFRKINRERNVWIYKHKLFHRDRPDDLYRVRRRTCPGVDGRKQRFSRFSARKISQFDEENKTSPQTSDDESSLGETSGDEVEMTPSAAMLKKRTVELDDDDTSKRTRRIWTSGKPSQITPKASVEVDTSIMSNPAPSPTSVFEAHESLLKCETEVDDDSSANKKNQRLEMVEQSMVVSEVAMKLEEYARKAMRGRATGRTRRGGAGVVTPPWSCPRQLTISSRGLITYDDEYETTEKNSGVVTDGDDSTASEDVRIAGRDVSKSKQANKEFLVAPVREAHIIKSITECILSSCTYQTRGTMVATAAVAGFCMMTPPNEDGELPGKITELISCCDKLAFEFQLYRGALRPLNWSSEALAHAIGDNPWKNMKTKKGVDGADAIRDFKIFAVNCMHKVLRKSGSFGFLPFSDGEASKLRYTADLWLKSVSSNS
jgi:hypothetical protein